MKCPKCGDDLLPWGGRWFCGTRSQVFSYLDENGETQSFVWATTKCGFIDEKLQQEQEKTSDKISEVWFFG